MGKEQTIGAGRGGSRTCGSCGWVGGKAPGKVFCDVSGEWVGDADAVCADFCAADAGRKEGDRP